MKNDLIIIGQPNQTAIINNILTDPAGAASIDVSGYRHCVIQVMSTASKGGYKIEESLDDIIFHQAAPNILGGPNHILVFTENRFTIGGVPSVITPTPNPVFYMFRLQARYLRLGICEEITDGTIQAIMQLSEPFW